MNTLGDQSAAEQLQTWDEASAASGLHCDISRGCDRVRSPAQ